MKMQEIFTDTFKALRHELGHDRPRDMRPMWQRRLSTGSAFCQALVANGYLTEEQMRRASERYRLGMSRDGGVIFWQIDQLEQLYDGKIMYYRTDCHRDHQHKPTWVSYLLKHHGQLPEDWKSQHCLFGLHLLKTLPLPLPVWRGVISSSAEESISKSIYSPPSQGGAGGGSQVGGGTCCVVESEKTAVIMSELYPDCLWLAAGGLYELTATKLFPLRRRKVILFPDTDTEGRAYATWYRVMQEAQRLLGQTIHLSPLLEQHATKAQKAAKIDIVDLMFKNEKWEMRNVNEK